MGIRQDGGQVTQGEQRPMRIRLEAIGCRLNSGEMERLGRQIVKSGHILVGPQEEADICVFNSCAVTQAAERKSRQHVRKLRRSSPGAKIVVTGCYAELGGENSGLVDADLIVGNRHKEGILDRLVSLGWLEPADDAFLLDNERLRFPTGRTRAFLKVQDGCDNCCTFCIVTVARGAGTSVSPERVVAEAQELEELGYREIVLSGVHLGSYGRDLGERRGLEKLIRLLLQRTTLPRIRLSSLEPWDIDEAFFELWQDSRLCRHLHLPLQSGHDALLKRMGRKTTTSAFARLLETARRAIPDLSVTTDVMVGFPGESDAEFDASYAFIRQMAFSRLHVFRYSPRPGTAAAVMSRQVPAEVAAERSRALHCLGAELEHAFARQYVGRTLEVLWESAARAGHRLHWEGLTSNYLRVMTETGSAVNLRNRLAPARLNRCEQGLLSGAIVPHLPAAPDRVNCLSAIPYRTLPTFV